MRKSLISFGFFLLMPMVAFAGDSSASLRSVVAQTLEHAPALQAAESGRNAAAEDAALGRAGLLPYFAGKGSVTRQRQDFTYDRPSAFLSPSVRNNERAYGIHASQTLFDLERWGAFQQGKASASGGELRFDLQKQQTILQASSAWLDVVRTQAAFEAAQASEQAMEKLAMQAEAAFEVGTAAMNDALAAKSRHALARAGRIRAGQMLEQAAASLNSLVGRRIEVSVPLSPGITPLAAIPDDSDLWEQRAEAHALGVQLSEKSVELAEAGHLKAVGSALPKLQLVAGWDRNISSDGSFGGSTVKGSYVGVELNVPLYAGGGAWAMQRKTTMEKSRAQFEREEARRMARLGAQQALLGLRTTAAEIEALDAALASAVAEKEAAQIGFEVGLRTITEAMDAEERLAVARRDYADAVARHAMAYLQLSAAAGDLDMQTPERVEALLR